MQNKFFEKIDKTKLTQVQTKDFDYIKSFKKDIELYNKNEIRKNLKIKRDNISEYERNIKSDRIFSKLINANETANASVIFCYLSYKSEVSTTTIINYLLNNDKTVLIPKIESNFMKAVKINDLSKLSINKFGIKEPFGSEEFDKNKIDVVIVPGLGFNKLGFRIGYGGGYYDRFLEEYNNFTIGICFEEQLTSKIIPDNFDIPVNKVITDKNEFSVNYRAIQKV